MWSRKEDLASNFDLAAMKKEDIKVMELNHHVNNQGLRAKFLEIKKPPVAELLQTAAN